MRYFPVLLMVNIILCMGGLELVEKMETLTKPQDMQSDMKMTLINKKGKSKTMEFRSFVKDKSKKQIMWFLSPPADKGISFMKIEEQGKPDQMHMWLPAFKKIRRISSRKRNDSFMGSDMNYEDLYTRDKDEYQFEIIGEEKINEQLCYILESTPIPELKSTYSRHKTWITTVGFITLRENSYDTKGRLLKEKYFKFEDFGQYKMATQITVKNVQKNHSTELTINNILVDTGLKNDLFHERHLKRIPRFDD